MINHTEVMSWMNTQVGDVGKPDAMRWVLAHWQELHDSNEAKLTYVMLTAINRQISRISTGKRREYQKALLSLVAYLDESLQWSIPSKEKRKLQDTQNKWFEEVRAQSARSQKLVKEHQQNIEKMVKRPFEVDSAVLAITLLLETAPILLPSIYYLISHPDVLEEVEGVATICYPISLRDTELVHQYARYKLSPLSYRLLKEYFKAGEYPKNVRELRSRITAYLSTSPFYFEKMSDRQLLLLVICHWQSNLPHFFVKDFINPARQFALSPLRYSVVINNRNDKFNSCKEELFNSCIMLNINGNTKQKWPHKQLLKQYQKIGKRRVLEMVEGEEPISWLLENILPQLYYLYVIELIKFGGVKKDRLAISTIETYTSGDDYLKQHPLSFDDAVCEDSLNAWANSFYDNAESDAVKLHLFYFLRFVAEQEITDALDIDAFQSVHLPKNVDANLVSPKELNAIMHLLAEGSPENKLQQLFCLVAVSLSFHGCLRRGEILRLRMCDIELSEPKASLFRLTIAHTAEGRTKNGKSRVVHVELPAEQAKLLRLLLKIKDKADYLAPIIGFDGELISSRERQYILPVTRAIKTVCGQTARFHHLRHGGSFVLTNQMLSLFLEPFAAPPCPYLSELLQNKFVKKRFYYWLEGRSIEQLNSVVALDQVADMIGHSLFETTRKSYLHGHEWVSDYFIPKTLQYSKPVLRYILGLNVGSNDISRRMSLLLKNDNKNVQSVLHSNVILHSKRVHEMAVNNARELSWLAGNEINIEGFNWSRYWVIKLAKESSGAFDLLIQKFLNSSNINQLLTWKELNQIKLLIYRNKPSTRYKKPIYKLIKQLLLKLSVEEHSFAIEMTKRAAHHYRKLFELPEFSVFKRHFILFKNQGTVSEKQDLFIKQKIFMANEKLTIKPIHLGKTKLIVRLELTCFSVDKLINLYRQLFL